MSLPKWLLDITQFKGNVVRYPNDSIQASLRAVDVDPRVNTVVRSITALGYLIFWCSAAAPLV